MKCRTDEELRARRFGWWTVASLSAACGCVAAVGRLALAWPEGSAAPEWAGALGLLIGLVAVACLLCAGAFMSDWDNARRKVDRER